MPKLILSINLCRKKHNYFYYQIFDSRHNSWSFDDDTLGIGPSKSSKHMIRQNSKNEIIQNKVVGCIQEICRNTTLVHSHCSVLIDCQKPTRNQAQCSDNSHFDSIPIASLIPHCTMEIPE